MNPAAQDNRPVGGDFCSHAANRNAASHRLRASGGESRRGFSMYDRHLKSEGCSGSRCR
jgi:hypothetical protein